jgi:hypothetical protein
MLGNKNRGIRWATIHLAALFALASGAAPCADIVQPVRGDEAKQEKGSTDPSGFPLELKLVAKQTTYVLDLGGKTEKEFGKQVRELADLDTRNPYNRDTASKYPPTPKVDFVLELHNTSKQPVNFLFGRRILYDPDFRAKKYDAIVFGHGTFVGFEVKGGPGALNVETGKVGGPNRDAEGYRAAPLAPGKMFTWPVKDLRYGPRYYNLPQSRNYIYWTKPGEYSLRAVLKTAVAGKGQGGFATVTVSSNWVKLEVVEKKAKSREGK